MGPLLTFDGKKSLDMGPLFNQNQKKKSDGVPPLPPLISFFGDLQPYTLAAEGKNSYKMRAYIRKNP